MKLEQLKKNIENKSISDELIIFKLSDIDFICKQYINEIANIKQLPIEYIEDISSLCQVDIFGINSINRSISVFKCEELNNLNKLILKRKNVIIICKNITAEIESKYEPYITIVPKLESWQIKDYIYSVLENVDTKKLDYLIDKCNNNIYRLDNEISKLTIFDNSTRENMFDLFVSDNAFSDLSKYSIFDFTNAIIKKDIDLLRIIYKEKSNMDIDTFGLITILLNSFRDILSVQCNPKMTADKLGVTSKKFWAIKYSCGFYSNEKLLHIFRFLCDIDKKIKLGELPTELVIDYIMLNILN